MEKTYLSNNGSPVVFYHGSTSDISAFSLDYIGRGVEQFGSGIYFTSSFDDANHYTFPRDSQPNEGNGNISPVFLSLQNPIIIDNTSENKPIIMDNKPLRKNKIRGFIMAAPNLSDALSNWGEVGYEKLVDIVNRAADSYLDYDSALDQINMISNDFYSNNEKLLLDRLYTSTGYDGVIIKNHGGVEHVVVWNPDYITSVFDPSVQHLSIIHKSVQEEILLNGNTEMLLSEVDAVGRRI